MTRQSELFGHWIQKLGPAFTEKYNYVYDSNALESPNTS